MLRPGSAGSNTAADHLQVLDEAIAALPSARRSLMITCDGAGASHDLVKKVDKLASRPGYRVTCSVGRALTGREKPAIGQVPETAWQAAIDGRGEVRALRGPPVRAPGLLDRGSARHRADRATARRIRPRR